VSSEHANKLAPPAAYEPSFPRIPRLPDQSSITLYVLFGKVLYGIVELQVVDREEDSKPKDRRDSISANRDKGMVFILGWTEWLNEDYIYNRQGWFAMYIFIVNKGKKRPEMQNVLYMTHIPHPCKVLRSTLPHKAQGVGYLPTIGLSDQVGRISGLLNIISIVTTSNTYDHRLKRTGYPVGFVFHLERRSI